MHVRRVLWCAWLAFAWTLFALPVWLVAFLSLLMLLLLGEYSGVEGDG